MIKIILLILNLVIFNYLAHSAQVNFSITLTNSAIELDCSYTIRQPEKFTSITITKDGNAFLKYAKEEDKNPTFNNVTGVWSTKLHGGCRLSILNYSTDSMGIYEIQLRYTNKKGKPAVAKKLYKTSMSYSNCKVTWVNTTGDNLPAGAFGVALRPNGDILRACRNMDGDQIGYFEQGKGCVYTREGKILSVSSFQVLTGEGYSWVIHWGGNEVVPSPKAVVIGKDHTGDIYIGRCNFQDNAYIGKVTDNFYFNQDSSEVANCPRYDVLVC